MVKIDRSVVAILPGSSAQICDRDANKKSEGPKERRNYSRLKLVRKRRLQQAI